ncbi:SLC30A2 [Blepharisma stoltei]|uniref:Uncharacterized protein n=1 Tax=Blepharisma stoltei TaxID=1481888 RepID=A0AAU9J313_9CILI|nr:unnamed protein product [Blepharisma stoltei]
MKENVLFDPLVFDDETKILIRRNNKTASLKKLYVVSAICTLFMISEVIGGVLANSLAILTDAAHMLSDLLGFGISVFSLLLAARPASRTMSFGYHRAEVIGALMSIILILILTSFLLYEAIYRIIVPEKVDGFIMLITAIVGLLCNIIMGKVLHSSHSHHDHHHHHHHHEHGDLNIRAAALHILGDILQSIGVIIASIIIFIEPTWSLADPLCTLLFSIIVTFTTFPIIKECIGILLEATPKGVKIKEIKEALKKVEGVINLDDLHVWSLSAGNTSLSCHLISNSPEISLEAATQVCKEKFKICHTTIQIIRPEVKKVAFGFNRLHNKH